MRERKFLAGLGTILIFGGIFCFFYAVVGVRAAAVPTIMRYTNNTEELRRGWCFSPAA